MSAKLACLVVFIVLIAAMSNARPRNDDNTEGNYTRIATTVSDLCTRTQLYSSIATTELV